MRADEEYMVSLWQHEMTRVVKDRISRSVDIKWFEKTLKAVIKEVKGAHFLETGLFITLQIFTLR